MPARIQVPMTDPTTSRIRIAPIEVAMPRRIAPSISAHDWPFAKPTSPATAVPRTRGDLVGAERGLVAEQVHRAAEQGDEQHDGDERLPERRLDGQCGG